MIALDTNILVYAHRAESLFHAKATAVVSALAQGREPWALLCPCLHEFVGVVTNPKIFKTPSPLAQALSQVDAWLGSPTVTVLSEDSDGYWPVFSRLVTRAKVQGPKVHDARVAALAVFHGVDELLTADRDFSRFSELATRNPLT